MKSDFHLLFSARQITLVFRSDGRWLPTGAFQDCRRGIIDVNWVNQVKELTDDFCVFVRISLRIGLNGLLSMNRLKILESGSFKEEID